MSYQDYFSGGGKPTPPPNPGYMHHGPRPIHPGPPPPNPGYVRPVFEDADYNDWREANPNLFRKKPDGSVNPDWEGVSFADQKDREMEFREGRHQEVEDYYASKPEHAWDANAMEEWKGNRPEWMTEEYTESYLKDQRQKKNEAREQEWEKRLEERKKDRAALIDGIYENMHPGDPRRKTWKKKKEREKREQRREYDDWLERMQEWHYRPRPHWQRGPSRNVKYRT
tara:strand:+ start:582 stop:1259 length:678 start_codon:yes stop_codon:yes gene_type:complete